MKNWQALNTLLAIMLGNFLAERWDAWAAATAGMNANTVELVLTGALAAAASWAIEWGRAFALDLTDAGRMPRLYKMLGGTLILFAFTACATADVAPDGTMRLTARGRSSVERCVGEGQAKECWKVKGGAISQAFGDVLLAPFKLASGILGGAAKGAADAAGTTKAP